MTFKETQKVNLESKKSYELQNNEELGRAVKL